ncbi:alpha/beta-hydrolase [Aspergillus keveii]|uniref:Alpha/beta-hydrolase n=1 Tax=Aspergillus keveii TaxID=714993 RepID=A0ABR4FZW6_9EURO
MDVLTLDDPRVVHKQLQVEDDITYNYMMASPDCTPTATVLLLHGWPDLAIGWRYQIPFLLLQGIQVIAPDLLGYGKTSAPADIAAYTLKRMSAHLAQIIRAETDLPVILGGHDWGSYLAWRLALYSPELVKGIFSFTVPYLPPTPVVVTLEEFVQANPSFQYQLQLASPVAEEIVDRSEAHLRGFLRSSFGGVTPKGLPGFDPAIGLDEETLLEVGSSPLVSEELIEHYVKEYSRHGANGPMNWYRTRTLNGEEEIPLAESNRQLRMPATIIMAGQDQALPPSMLDGQEAFFPAGLTKGVINEASHWALIHTPVESNTHIGEFLDVVLQRKTR